MPIVVGGVPGVVSLPQATTLRLVQPGADATTITTSVGNGYSSYLSGYAGATGLILSTIAPTADVELLSLGIDQSGYILTSVDVGFPSVRASSVSRSGQDGESDVTKFIGARAISAEVVLPELDYYLAQDQLRALMHPAARLWLYLSRDGWTGERRILVRGATFTVTGRQPITANLGWQAPFGVFEDAVASTTVLSPVIQNAEGGLSSPLASPWTFTPGFTPGAAQITVGGSIPTYLTADLYGPCQNPTLQLVDTGETLAFNLTLAAGDFLRVDMESRTAYLNGDTAQSRYSAVDFARSTWWQVSPGSRQVAFYPTAPAAGCQAVVFWRSRYL